MKYNHEGFLYPVVNKTKCTECGLCLKTCPASGYSYEPHTTQPKCYAAFSNKDIAEESSSGGIFSLLANLVLDAGGYVCGAAFDEHWQVKHKIINNKYNLQELKTSKYVQSDTDQVYSIIKNLLENGSIVLFSGTPCQVAGLYGFLKKDYNNLLTVDVFCHGVPSPEVWKEYLAEFTDNPLTIKTINFRDKYNNVNKNSWEGGKKKLSGWQNFHLTINMARKEK